MVLLLLTTADLTGSISCALDGESAPLLAAVGLTQPAAPLQHSEHVDDCFCCSHCVDVQAVLPPLKPLELSSAPVPPPHHFPRHFGSPLYHPPLV